MPKKTRYLVGGGGHGRVLLDAIISSNQNVSGIIDSKFEKGSKIFGVTVVGDDSMLDLIHPSTDELVNGLGSTGDLELHRKLFDDLSNRGFIFCGAIHPSAQIGRECEIDKTSQIMAGAVVQNRVKVGRNVIINTRASIDHDVSIGDNSIISPGAIICGGVTVGKNVFIGAGAVIIQGIKIGNECIIGAGTIVRHNVKDSLTSLGKTQRESTDYASLIEYDTLIKDHYDDVGKSTKNPATSTMSDQIVRGKETEFILRQVTNFANAQKNIGINQPHEYSIIDVGCGSGHTLLELSKSFPLLDLVGIEQNEKMRESATQTLDPMGVKVFHGDVRNLKALPDKKFDLVICQRVLINILKVSDQVAALENLLSIIRPSGRIIFIESFKSGLNNLNEARFEFGLDKILPAHHNLYLDDDFFCHPQLTKLEDPDENVLSSHYFVSRVLHPAILKALGIDELRNSKFASFMSTAITNSIGEYSPLKFCAYEKLG
jgi:sugar O-acyltransferase (sialic acid O-acetyltransferase NeuD family)